MEYRHLEFYGLSEFWYSMHDLLMVGEDYSRADFERAAKVNGGGIREEVEGGRVVWRKGDVLVEGDVVWVGG